MKSGVYQIRCGYNGKVFVGKTKDFPLTLQQVLWKLRVGKHENVRLQEDYSKYPASFSIELLEELQAVDLHGAKEKWVTDLGTLDAERGYNQRIGFVPHGRISRAVSQKGASEKLPEWLENRAIVLLCRELGGRLSNEERGELVGLKFRFPRWFDNQKPAKTA